MKKKQIWTVLLFLLVIADYSNFFVNYATDPHIILNYLATTLGCLALGLWVGDK